MIIDPVFMEKLHSIDVPDYFEEALFDAYHKFSEQIMMELTSFSYDPNSFGFSNLGLISREYAIQKYFEPRIETYVRQYLVTNFFERVLEKKGYDVYTPTYYTPDDTFLGGEIFCSNKEFEENAQFEFVIQTEQNLIGCRMTDIHAWNVEKLFQLGLVTKIIIIDWNNPEGINEEEKKRRTYGIRKNVDILGINEFVKEWLGEPESKVYDLFIHKVLQCYQDTIGISSHPKLTSPLFFEHRLEVEKEVKRIAEDMSRAITDVKRREATHNEESIVSIGYRLIDINNFKTTTEKETALRVEEESIKLFAETDVLYNFLSMTRYKALVGKSDFAKSFLTSEYLYSQYNENDLFDYTAIVSGYLKSIEQLLSIIVFNFANDPKGTVYRIKSNGKKDNDGHYPVGSKKEGMIYKIDLSESNAEYVDTTIGSLIHFVKDYKQHIMTVDPAYQTAIVDSLECYRIECRNDSFHSHNNYIWQKVETIRHNTIQLYVMLLGSFRLIDDSSLQNRFGIIQNDDLERIYYWLRKKRMYSFRVKLSDGKYYEANRKAEKEFPAFDHDGLLAENFAIEISCTKEDANREQKKKYIIDRNNIPEEIWFKTYMNSHLVFCKGEGNI